MAKFGHEILTSEFPDDDGSIDPKVTAALIAAQSKNQQDIGALIDLLANIRVLVPVLAEV
ncbi:MAG: hypothetical protein RL410_1474, partial [Actinomycetota bacterium]